MRVIFVPVADRPECAAALNTAFVLGHTEGAKPNICRGVLLMWAALEKLPACAALVSTALPILIYSYVLSHTA